MSRYSRAQEYEILVEPRSTLKNHCELKTSLTDKPDTVFKSPDNSEPNQWGWFFDFFSKIFCTGPLDKLLPLRFGKPGRVWCGGAPETHSATCQRFAHYIRELSCLRWISIKSPQYWLYLD